MDVLRLIVMEGEVGALWVRGQRFAIVMLLFFLIILSGRVIAANNETEHSRNYAKERSSDFLNGSILRGSSYILGGKVSSDFRQNITYDHKANLYRVTYASAIYELTAEVDANLLLKYSKWQTRNSELINRLGHDKRITYYDAEHEVLKIEYYKGEELKEIKNLSYDEDTLDSDLIYLYLQKVLTPENNGANCDIILKSRGLKINVVFHQLSTKDLLNFTPQYQFLDGFCKFARQMEEQGEELEVYVMDLTGIPRLLFPHKYHLAFKKTIPRQFVAYWGGAPKAAEFTFIE